MLFGIKIFSRLAPPFTCLALPGVCQALDFAKFKKQWKPVP